MVQRFSREGGVFFVGKRLPDSVMVAHKILILGVQVRALVGQNPLWGCGPAILRKRSCENSGRKSTYRFG